MTTQSLLKTVLLFVSIAVFCVACSQREAAEVAPVLTNSGGQSGVSSTPITDAALYDSARTSAQAPVGYAWYNCTSALLNRSSLSGHGAPFLRTRYNSIAAKQLDSTGKVKANAIFPEGSLIIKDIIVADRTTISLYAAMIKKKDDPNADRFGWVWTELFGNGNVLISVSGKGVACTSCHSQAGNVDLTLMNVSFPK